MRNAAATGRKGDPVNEGGEVLVSRFSALGDVAMTLPPIYDACLSNPGRRFILLTRRHPASLFINPPANLIIHAIDTADYPGVRGMWRLSKELRDAYNITAYADLHNVTRTRLLRLFFRLGRGVRISKVFKDRKGRGRLTRRRNKHLVQLPPMSDLYAKALADAGVPGSGHPISLFPEKPDPAIFAKATPPKRAGERWIGIAPFAAHPGKIYPPEHIAKTIRLLLRDPDVKIFIFGFGDKEREAIEKWRLESADPARIVDMASAKLGLPAELALISHCDAMLSMDSANMHLASLAGTRCVSIWGATHPYCGFRPANADPADILQLNMTCRPCSVYGNRPCHRGDYRCLSGISPERVAARLLATDHTHG